MKKIIVLFISVLLCCMISGCGNKLSVDYIGSLLTAQSELTTAKLTITGFAEFEDDGVEFINKSDFVMVYQATVRAGVDLSDVEIEINNFDKVIEITIPDAKIHEVKVDPSSIKYYDTDFSFFNLDAKEDANKAQLIAEEKAEEYAETTGILEFADEQAKQVIKGILSGNVDNYEIIFND